jgi:hypothetical protein
MASPLVVSVDWGDVVTTSLENRSRKLADNLTNNNALLMRLRKRGNSNTFSGGREIMQELAYTSNATFMWYSGYEPLNIALNDTMTAARFAIKQCAIAVVISGLEEIQNSGEEAMMNLIAQRGQVAENSFLNAMSTGIYSDGTAFGGKQIGGLQLLVSKTPTTGTVGGIDASAQTWWRNVALNNSTDPLGAFVFVQGTTNNIQSYFNKATLSLKRNSDGVDMIVADTIIYNGYLNSLQTIQRINSDGAGSAGSGFTALKYYGAGKEVDVILDGGKGGQVPATTAYFINSEFLFFRPSSARNFVVIGGERANVNQDAIVKLSAWAGNMTVSNRSLQGVIF